MPESPKPERFKSMDLGAAAQECSSPTIKENFVTHDDQGGPLRCPRCLQPVFLHCPMCKIQTTGCLCTEIDRFGQDEAWQRAVERYGAEIAKGHFQNMGLWVPPGIERN